MRVNFVAWDTKERSMPCVCSIKFITELTNLCMRPPVRHLQAAVVLPPGQRRCALRSLHIVVVGAAVAELKLSQVLGQLSSSISEVESLLLASRLCSVSASLGFLFVSYELSCHIVAVASSLYPDFPLAICVPSGSPVYSRNIPETLREHLFFSGVQAPGLDCLPSLLLFCKSDPSGIPGPVGETG